MNRTKHHRRLVRRVGRTLDALRDALSAAGAETDRARFRWENARASAYCPCARHVAARRASTFTAQRLQREAVEATREAYDAAMSLEARLSCDVHRLENVHAFAVEVCRYARLRRDDPIAWRDAP